MRVIHVPLSAKKSLCMICMVARVQDMVQGGRWRVVLVQVVKSGNGGAQGTRGVYVSDPRTGALCGDHDAGAAAQPPNAANGDAAAAA
jgi:hypothetical protein